jgi:alpha-tubulin suppressor-like RCC1 family protein
MLGRAGLLMKAPAGVVDMLYAWGENSQGQLGTGDRVTYTTPVPVSGGGVWKDFSIGHYVSVGVKADGSLWVWGNGEGGYLGLGDTTDRLVPTQLGSATNWVQVSSSGTDNYPFWFALNSLGELWAVGRNGNGELGVGDAVSRTTLTRVGAATDWAYINAAGGYNAYAIKTNGTLWSTGYGGHYQLGFISAGVTVFTQVGTDSDWATVWGGTETVMAVKTNGSVWTWGYPSNGSHGMESPTTMRYDFPSLVTGGETGAAWRVVTEGVRYSMGIKGDGTLWGWGRNISGQLGLGDTVDKPLPIQVGSDNTWVAVGTYWVNSAPVTASATTYAIKADGTLWVCGSGFTSSLQQLGTDTDWHELNRTAATLSMLGRRSGDEFTPNIPVATAATNNAGTSFTANWNAATRAAKYYLSVSTNPYFTSYVSGYQDKEVTGTSDSVTGVNTATTTYYYRVKAANGGGSSFYSNSIAIGVAASKYIFLRWRGTNLQNSGSRILGNEMSVRATPGGAAQLPQRSQCSMCDDAASQGDRQMCDGITGNPYWSGTEGSAATPHTLIFRWDTPITIAEVEIATNWPDYQPRDCKFEASIDGVTWVTLGSYTGLTWTGWKTFTF